LYDWLRASGRRILQASGLRRPFVSLVGRFPVGAGIKSGDAGLDARLFMRRSAERLRRAAGQAAGVRVLFTGIVGWSDQHAMTAATLAQALRLRGADARALVCDSALAACEAVHANMFHDVADFLRRDALPRCPSCQGMAEGVLGGLGIPTLHLSDYLEPADADQVSVTLEVTGTQVEGLSLAEMLSYHEDGMDIGEQVRTSVHRFFLVGTLVDDAATVAVTQKYLAAAIALARALRRVYETWRPEVVVANHGIYLYGGLSCEVARHCGVRIVTWDLVYRRHCLQMSHGDTYHHEFRKEPWDAWEGLSLSAEQEVRLDAYLAQRREGALAQDAVSYNEGALTDGARIARDLGLAPAPDRLKLVLFTNVAWDGRVHVDSSIYDGPTEWVIGTLQHLAGREDVQVVVRIHPAEVKETAWKGLQRVDDEIRKAFPTLPSNVVLIPPESTISSYALAGLADVVGVYSTLMGLESLLMGVPTIVAGDALYSNKGFGVQPSTRAEYLAVLDRLDEIAPPDAEALARVRRYAYHFFFRRWLQLPLPYYGGAGVPLARTLADLLPGRSNDLDRACKGILDGTPFHVGAD